VLLRPAVLLSALAPLPAVACSGPDVAGTIRNAETAAWVLFAVSSAALVCGTALYRFRRWPVTSLIVPWVLMVVHPVWWLDSVSGDCGANKVGGSLVVLLLQSGLLWAMKGPPTFKD
jgi:hypothetical protein